MTSSSVHPNAYTNLSLKFERIDGRTEPYPSELTAIMDRNKKHDPKYQGVCINFKASDGIKYHQAFIVDLETKKHYNPSFSVSNMPSTGVSPFESRKKTGTKSYVTQPYVSVTQERSSADRKKKVGNEMVVVHEDPHTYVIRVAEILESIYDAITSAALDKSNVAAREFCAKYLTQTGKGTALGWNDSFPSAMEVPDGNGGKKTVNFEGRRVIFEIPLERDAVDGLSKKSERPNALVDPKRATLLDARTKSIGKDGKTKFADLKHKDPESGKESKVTNGNMHEVLKGGTKWTGVVSFGQIVVSALSNVAIQKPSFYKSMAILPGNGSAGLDEDLASQVEIDEDGEGAVTVTGAANNTDNAATNNEVHNADFE